MIWICMSIIAGLIVIGNFHIKDLKKEIKMKNDEIAILSLANIELQQKLNKEI